MKRIKPISRGAVKQALMGQGLVLDILEKVMTNLAGELLGGKGETEEPAD